MSLAAGEPHPPVERGRLRAGGARVEYARWPGDPSRPTLALLHEGLGCVDLWRDFPARLAAATGAPVLAWSRPGYGRSDPVPLPRPLDYMEREGESHVGAVLAAAGVGDAVLVGHSDGASVAIVHAGTAPHPGLRGLVLVAPHVFTETVSLASIRRAGEAWREGGLRERLARYHGANVECAFLGWHDSWTHPRFERWNIEDRLARIRVPVLVVQGVRDQYGTVAQVEAIERGVPGGAARLLIEACGHSPHREAERMLVAAVGGFLNGLAPGPAPPPGDR